MIDNFSKLVWTIPLKEKSSQRTKDSIKSIPIGSKISPYSIETDRGKQISKKELTVSLNKNNIKSYSRFIALLAVYVKRYNRTVKGLLKNMFLKEQIAFGSI